MMLQPDLMVAQQRHADLLREAQNARLANQARHAGDQPLIGRMAMLLAAFGKRMDSPAQPKAKLIQRGLASTGPR